MEGLAAFGVKFDNFTPQAATRFDFVNQILPSLIPVFSPTDSKTHSMDFEMACTAPPAHLSRRWVHQGGSVGCLFRGIVWERRICFG